jgi:hypothetical protein
VPLSAVSKCNKVRFHDRSCSIINGFRVRHNANAAHNSAFSWPSQRPNQLG